MIRRFGPPPLPAPRYRLRPGAYALIRRGDQVLPTFQQAPMPEFQLPGGGIDPGEGPLGALHREVLEEVGYTIAPLRALGAYRRFCWMPEYNLFAEKLCHVWLARAGLRRGLPTEPGHSAHWVPAAAAPGLLADPGARAFAQMALRAAD